MLMGEMGSLLVASRKVLNCGCGRKSKVMVYHGCFRLKLRWETTLNDSKSGGDRFVPVTISNK